MFRHPTSLGFLLTGIHMTLAITAFELFEALERVRDRIVLRVLR